MTIHEISTHALTEGDLSWAYGNADDFEFQLTPSRRATLSLPKFFIHFVISTHALTEGDIIFVHTATSTEISTHALTEGDEPSLFFTTFP